MFLSLLLGKSKIPSTSFLFFWKSVVNVLECSLYSFSAVLLVNVVFILPISLKLISRFLRFVDFV